MGRSSWPAPPEQDGGSDPARISPLQSAQQRWVEAAGSHLLVVDPHPEQLDLRLGLADRGVCLNWSRSTTDALVEFGRTEPDAVVVALDTPGISAAEFVSTIRRHGSPYVMAAGDQVTEAAAGVLMAGAGTWLQRPYAADDLWARLASSPHPTGAHVRLAVGTLTLDAAAYRVSIGDRRLPDLPLKEFELLRALMLRAPEVVGDAELTRALWGTTGGATGRNNIAMHVTRLRARLGGVVSVRRVRGRGYALTVDG